MTWFEYLDWRLYRWRMTRRCNRRGHDNISQPELTLGGWYVRLCYTCGARFDQRTVMAMKPAAASAEIRRWTGDAPRA